MDEIKTPKNDLASLLRDFAQGASNSVAGNVAVPVDAIAWLLRKGGVNVPPNPVMGSDWMAEKGLTREPQNKLAGFVGDMAGMVAPFAAASKAPQIAKGLLAAGDAMPMGSKSMPALSKSSPMADRGAIVWHGSPHKFDKFDASKIGTGEGAQAYGHGLYLAENPSVAKQYQAALSNPKYSSGGRELKGNEAWAAQFLHDFQGDALPKKVDANAAIAKAQELLKVGDTQSEILKHIKNLDNAGVSVENGALYKVDLPDEHIAKMLDWDKPLSQQHPDIQNFASTLPESSNIFKKIDLGGGKFDVISPNGKSMGIHTSSEVDDAIRDYSNGFMRSIGGKPITGGDLYQRLANNTSKETPVISKFGSHSKSGQPEVSDLLRQAGIPGIKYLDEGSRGAGQGSSNYVVFPGNERLLKILERNGESVAPKFEYPQSQALELAQQRAALPLPPAGVDITKLPQSEARKYGLGLRADNTALERANASKDANSVFDMNFNNDVYHGGSSDIRAPSYEFSGKGHDQYGSAALYTATNPTLASGYAEKALEGANVMPLRINTKGFVSDTNVPNLTSAQISEMIKKSPDKDAIYNFGDVDYEGLNKVIGNAVKEYKSVSDDGLSQLNMLSNDFYPNNPAEFNKGISKLTGIRGVTADVGAGEKFHMPWHEDDIRSRFAAFDPWRRNAAIAATMGVAAPDLLANPLDDKNNRLIDILRNK